MDPIWIVLADEGHAHIVALCRPGGELRLLEHLVDSTAVPPPGEDVPETEVKRFARQIVDRLEQAYDEARFEWLRIAAAPRFVDDLRREIDKHRDLHRAVLDWVPKNLVELEPEEAVRRMGPCEAPGSTG